MIPCKRSFKARFPPMNPTSHSHLRTCPLSRETPSPLKKKYLIAATQAPSYMIPVGPSPTLTLVTDLKWILLTAQFEKLLHWDCVSTAVILVQLKTALFYVTEMCSLYTSSCLLQLDRLLIKLLLTQGLNNHSPPQQLSYLDKMKFKTLPHDTWTVLSNLSIDPDLEYLMWCPACFVMYPDDKNAPKNCSHHRVPKVEEPKELEGEWDKLEAELEGAEELESTSDQICGATLFKQCGSGRQPIQRFASQNLVDWLARLFCRENIEEALEKIACKSLSPFDSLAEMFDIQDSPIWQEFRGADGKQFTANSGNVVFGMFTDGINPYGNWQGGKCASVTFIIMVCMSLPVSLHYWPKNIFLVGIAPGPRKPSLEQVNWFLTPVVKQLQTLWSPGVYLSKTPLHPKGQLVSATLIPFFADLLALCRSLGFASHTAKRMCSYCLFRGRTLKTSTQKLGHLGHWRNTEIGQKYSWTQPVPMKNLIS